MVTEIVLSRLMTCVWAAEISTHHKDRAAAIAAGVCVIPWRHQPTLNVIAMEYTGTLLLTLLPRMVFTNPFLANNDSHKVIRGAVISLIVLVVVMNKQHVHKRELVNWSVMADTSGMIHDV